ncbi:MAG: cytochrome c peroxidase, partial [Blastocatellia bacterium]
MLEETARGGLHETRRVSLRGKQRVVCAALIGAAFLLGLGRLGGSRTVDASNPQSSVSATSASAEQSAEVKLGARLFHDDRFSSPKGDFLSSCSRCHQFDQDPQGLHAYNDLLNRSWQPFRIEDPRREAARNAPVLLDSGVMPRLHYDGEFTSLEDLIKGTLSGRTMGWLPNERDEAFDFVRKIVLSDQGDDSSNAESYDREFQTAYRVEAAKLERDKLIDLVSRAIAAYVRTLKTSRATPYDELVKLNGIPDAPAAGETPRDYAAGVISRVAKLQAAGLLRLPKGFDREALTGMKIFFRTDGARAVGDCAVCHVPPYFTDFSFHNLGISQTDYDRVHGEGRFAALRIPG